MIPQQLISKDTDTGEHSTSKLWLNITNVAVISIYLMLGYNLYKQPTPNLEGWSWLTLVVAGIVTGNRLANIAMNKKFGGINDSTAKPTKE